MQRGHGEGIRRQRNEEAEQPLKSYFLLVGGTPGLLCLANIWKRATAILQWDGTVEEGAGGAALAEKRLRAWKNRCINMSLMFLTLIYAKVFQSVQTDHPETQKLFLSGFYRDGCFF